MAWPGRWWRSWRAKKRLLASWHGVSTEWFYSRHPGFSELRQPDDAFAEIPAYDSLATVWHGHSLETQADYTTFLANLASERNRTLSSVLDLACGPGTLAGRLASFVPEVVGLDASEAMLAQGRARCDLPPGVSFVRGDFRTFQLGRQFDAVVCSGNSLNYVADVSELAAVFRRVAEHLRPGGVFVFDTQTEYGMRAASGLCFNAKVGDRRFVLRFSYDPSRRRETSQALLPGIVETHRRIPIDPRDVKAGAAGSGLRLDDYFSRPLMPGWWAVGQSCFFVMTRVR